MNKKTILITGGASGLGEYLTNIFAENNYNVILTYLNSKNIDSFKKELEIKYNIKVLAIKCDLANEDDINNLYTEVKKEFNSIDVIINNASICNDTLFEDKNKNNFMKILEVNLVGTFLLTKKLASLITSGSIINIASTNGIDSYYEYSLDYDASKAGIINLTHNLANYYAPNIRVNAICPGWIDTAMNKDMDPSFKEKEINKILLKRFAHPQEIAELALFLASEKSSYICDSIIKIDGGVKHE